MPRLTDDTRYARAFEASQRVKIRELAVFRRRLASRVVGMVANAMSRMGDVFDEDVLREELAGFESAYVEESMAYISASLIASGEIELAKRIGEVVDKVGIEDLPAEFQAGYEELQRGGGMAPYVGIDVPGGPPDVSTEG